MDDGAQSEPIEIELTPTDSAHEPASPDTERQGGEPPVRSASESRRLVIVALVTGLLALALGWMLGRSGSDSAAPDEQATSTTASPPETTVAEVEGDPIPAVDDPAPATDPGPTTTVPDVRTDVVAVHPALAGRSDELVGIDTSGHLATLDLATGELRTHTGRRFNNDGYAPISAGPDWIAVTQFDWEGLVVVREGEEPEPADVDDVWVLVRVPGTDRFWRPVDGDGPSAFGSQVYEEISLRDGPTGRRVEATGSFSVLADPAGALVASSAGRAYAVDPDGSTLLGEGDLLAVGADVAVFRQCDDTMRCYLAVLDRSTGALVELPVDQAVVAGIEPTFWGYPPSMAPTISPTGEFSVIRPFLDDGPSLAVLDLRSGAVTTLAVAGFAFPSLEWSNDGRFAFFTDRATPMAWDSTTGEVLRVAEDVSGWNGLAVRAGPRPPSDG